MHSIHAEDEKSKVKKNGRWGKQYKDKRNWVEYNEELVIRGRMIFDLDFVQKWDAELKRMNSGKRGSPYLFPESFMRFMMIWKQYLDYRGLEGMARSLVDLGIMPYYGDYTTIWHRIHNMRPCLDVSGLESISIGTDGTGFKTNNAGAYRVTKYGDQDAKRRKHLVVIITADVKTKHVIGIEVHIEGQGPSEPETAQKHTMEAVMNNINVRGFYGDGAFDTNDLFTLMHQIGAQPVIKIRKNASPDHYKGSKYRRRAIREYQNKGYRSWSEKNDYGMRWPCTEGIFSAVKRKFGENCVSRSTNGLISEGYQRIWVYNYMNQGAKKEARSLNRR
ncbi:IS5 family transposase [Cuniculiplasma sp. SKW3]|uniref:IS5 family transposase n=1 Tax=Cuniculiplasma sp. SKW3 TaxID=3400170 RepID=UPI003FD09C71